MAPNGYALQAVMILDRELETGEYLLAGLRYDDEPDFTWNAYFGRADGANEFRTYIGLDFPESNGLTGEPDLAGALPFETEIPELRSSGIGGELGQKYICVDDYSIWALWLWSFGDEEAEPISFDAYVGQYSLETGTYFAYADSITVQLAGAAQLTASAALALAFICLH